MRKPLLSLSQVCKYYQMGETKVTALEKVDLDIFSGDFITVTGSSGSGKSTLLHMIGLLDRPSSGKIFYSGKRVDSFTDDQLARLRNEAIGFVFQQFNLLPRTSVLDNVLLPIGYNDKIDFDRAKEKAKKILADLGMGKRITHFPNQLSGGEQQRTAIARALVCDPEIILADEPTGNLDSKTGKEIVNLLVALNKERGKTLILVTHDPQLAKLGKKKINLFDGMIIKKRKK